MIRDAEAHADEAQRLRELADAKNQAESLVYATEKSLKEHRDKINESEASTIEGRIMELKQAARGLDVGEIRAKSEALPRPRTRSPTCSTSRRRRRRPRRRSGDGTSLDDDEVVEEGDYEVIDEEAKTS